MRDVVDADVAVVGKLLADTTRCQMLQVLLDGTERPAGELARAGSVTAATASGHLSRLIDGGLVVVRQSGRHRYYALAGPLVAAVLEAMALISPPVAIRSLRQSRTAIALAEARSCYDHLAGRASLPLRAVLLGRGALVPDGTASRRQGSGGQVAGALHYRLTDVGRSMCLELGIDPDGVERSKRPIARDCLDWTERRPHLAGALPAALLGRFLELGWVSRNSLHRGLTVTELGRRNLAGLGGAAVGDAAKVS
jgi:DNA-binding transcriptional ArsR family regulator